MEIRVTAREILDRGVWDEFCMKHGINVWSVNEGLMSPDEKFTLTEVEARELGFLAKPSDR